jgi:branched-chain amino acid transport system substrate-binding protein
VELIVEDTEATPEVGLRKANKLLEEDDVDFGTGIVSSAVALQIAGAFEEAETPLVISNAISNALTGAAKSEFVFRTSFSSYQASYPVGRWLAEKVEGSLHLAAPDYAAGHELADGVRAGYVEAGGEIAGEVFPAFKDTQDYQPYLSQIAASGAASTYAFFAGSEAANFVKQYDQFGLKKNIGLYGVSLTTPEVLEAQGASAEGVYNVQPYSWTLDTPRNKKFVEAYRAKTDRNPSFYAAHSFDAAQLIAQAVEAADGDVTDGAALAASMEGATIDSPRGSLSIDADNHGTIQQMYIARMEYVDGELAPVVVAELGTTGEQPKK